MTRFVLIFATAACLALGGCAPSENDPAPGGVTVSEAQALDDAAEMIEQRRLPEGAIASDNETLGEAEPTSEPETGEGE